MRSDDQRLRLAKKEAAQTFERAAIVAFPCREVCVPRLFALMGRHRSLYLFLYRRHIEARALLHWRKVDEGWRLYFPLHKHKTPDLECKPVVVGDRPVVFIVIHLRPLVRVQSQVNEDWPIDFHRGTKPAVWLVGEAVLVIADPHRTQCGFGEIENLVALRRTLAR